MRSRITEEQGSQRKCAVGLQESAVRDAAKGNAVAKEIHIVKKKLSTFHWDKRKRP